MILARECDERESILVRQGIGAFHVGQAGHEAISGFACAMEAGDYAFTYYRDRALVLALGYGLSRTASDFFGSRLSGSGGANLPAHATSSALNIFPVATPTGSQCLPAVGAAWAIQRRGGSEAVICTIGDAATREGEFYEAVCFAIQERLPIVFAVHDNGFGISTRTAGRLPFDFGIFGDDIVREIDASRLTSVIDAARSAFSRARRGGGPTILHCKMERLCSHTSSDDQSTYRSPGELAKLADCDPISRYAVELAKAGVLTKGQLSEIEREIHEMVDTAYAAAAAEQVPDVTEMLATLFGPDRPLEGLAPALPAGSTIVSAINSSLAARLVSEPSAFVLGQDVEDPKGGVFGFTKGLSTRFPGRVVNAPLAEATMVGAGVGLAAVGARPIVEVQFIDFIAPAFQQLSAQAATLRWRSAGDWTCPMVIYAPYGAYLPSGGPWHSQANEAILAHIPGVRVAIPSTPQDATDLFEAAYQSEDPSVLLIPKHIFRIRHEATSAERERLGFGRARVVRSGGDVTIVAWGNCVSLAVEAAELASGDGIDAEVIDLRSVVPCDWETVSNSIARTGRLIVVQEDSRTCGFGQAVISEVTGQAGLFRLLKEAPILISRPDSHIPFRAEVELGILPSVADIQTAIQSLGF